MRQVQSYKTSHAGRGPYYGHPEEHVRTLETAKTAISALAKSRTLLRHAQPVLCHPDFHPGNIFVSNNDSTSIESVIDWQFTSVMPRFTQVRWPLFLTPPEGYRTGMDNPELAPEYHRKGCKGHAAGEQRQEQAMRTKCYEAALVKTHLDAYLALTETDVAIRQLFTTPAYTYREGILPLRDSLIHIYQCWSQLGLGDGCPYQFSQEEVLRHEKQMTEYRGWLKLREYTHDMLHCNEGGWVAPQFSFEQAQMKHEKLYRHFIQTRTDHMSAEDAKKLWFFRERI